MPYSEGVPWPLSDPGQSTFAKSGQAMRRLCALAISSLVTSLSAATITA
ncbi:hypothetical protein [Leclercia adecarboxylata]|nr:hypothetical protein [Leclercia adecarboxylata]